MRGMDISKVIGKMPEEELRRLLRKVDWDMKVNPGQWVSFAFFDKIRDRSARLTFLKE